MKINQEMKRKIVQVAAFGYSNTYIGNFVSGQIYKGRWKQFCNPGMNCYSCPAARLACRWNYAGSQWFYEFQAQFLYDRFCIGTWSSVWKSNLWFFLSVWSDSGTDLQDSISKEKIMERLTYVKYVLLAVFVVIMPVTMVNEAGMSSPAFANTFARQERWKVEFHF